MILLRFSRRGSCHGPFSATAENPFIFTTAKWALFFQSGWANSNGKLFIWSITAADSNKGVQDAFSLGLPLIITVSFPFSARFPPLFPDTGIHFPLTGYLFFTWECVCMCMCVCVCVLVTSRSPPFSVPYFHYMYSIFTTFAYLDIRFRLSFLRKFLPFSRDASAWLVHITLIFLICVRLFQSKRLCTNPSPRDPAPSSSYAEGILFVAGAHKKHLNWFTWWNIFISRPLSFKKKSCAPIIFWKLHVYSQIITNSLCSVP